MLFSLTISTVQYKGEEFNEDDISTPKQGWVRKMINLHKECGLNPSSILSSRYNFHGSTRIFFVFVLQCLYCVPFYILIKHQDVKTVFALKLSLHYKSRSKKKNPFVDTIF